MTRVTVTEARQDLKKIVNRAANRGDRVLLRRREKDIAAIVPIEDLRLIEAMEDQLDTEAAHEALAESDQRFPYHLIRNKLIENVRDRTHKGSPARSGKSAKRSPQARGRQNSVTR